MHLRRSPGCERAGFRAAGGLAALVLIGCAGPPQGAGEGQIYRWTDAAGVQHYALDPDDVPAAGRATLERVPRAEPPRNADAAPSDAPAPGAETPAPVAESPVAETPVAEPPADDPLPPLDASPPPEGPPPSERRARSEALPESVPAPAGAARGARRYAIQLAADADAELPQLSLAPGLQLYMTELERGGERLRRIRVGFFESRADALRELRALESRFPGAWVAPVDEAEWQRATRGGRGAVAPAPVDPPAVAPPAAVPAPRAAPAIPPAAAPAAAGSYTLQLFARPQGERLGVVPIHDLFHTKILYVLGSEVQGRAFRRLRLGFFVTEQEAEAARRSLLEHFPEAWVARADAAERAEAVSHRIVPDQAAPPASSGPAPPLRE